MKSIKNIVNLILLPILFAVFFIVGATNISADTACGTGYTCTGSGAYKRVNSCTTDYFGWCQNDSITDHATYSCPTGGGSGSCVGLAEGVNGCTGSATTTISCGCDQPGYGCSSDGAACGTYGTCNCTTTVSGGCPSPSDGFRGCCLGDSAPPPTTPPATVVPTPTPSTCWCGDGIANCGETCYTCRSDVGDCPTPQPTPPPTGVPTPTPPPTTRPPCGDGICTAGSEDYCSCAKDCPYKNCLPKCDISISPDNVTMSTTDEPFLASAVVTNVTNGFLDEVRFGSTSGAATLNPVTINGGSFPYPGPFQTTVTPKAVGNATITAIGVVNGVEACNDELALTIEPPPPTCGIDEPPDCGPGTMMVNLGNPVTEGDTIDFQVYMYDVGENLLCNGSFENGTSQWTASPDIGAFQSVSVANWLNDGLYFARLERGDDGILPFDPYLVSDFFDVGYDVTGHNFVMDYEGLTNGSGPLTQTINGISIQRYPLGAFTSYDTKYTGNSVFYNNTWTSFHRVFSTWSPPANGNTSSRVRVVLRTPPCYPEAAWCTDYSVYYDDIKLYDIDNTGVNPASLRWFIKKKDPLIPVCDGSTWIEIFGNQWNFNWYYHLDDVDLSTAGPGGTPLEPGEYYITVNSEDILGNRATGNPGGCGSAYFQAERPNCSSIFTVDSCDSCDPSCASYIGATPNQVTGLTINGQGSGGSTHNTLTSTPMTYYWNNVTMPPGLSTANQYQIRMWNRFAPGFNNSVPSNTTCSNNPSNCRTITRSIATYGNTYSGFPDTIPDNTMAVAVRAVNTACTSPAGAWSPVVTHNLYANIGGNIYNNTASYDAITGTCTGTTNPQVTLPSTASLTSSNGSASPDSLANQNHWRIVDLPFAPTSTWTNRYSTATAITSNASDVPAYTCICPPPPGSNPFECIYYDRFAGAGSSMSSHIFVSDIILNNGPWWQTSRGNIFAGSQLQEIKSDIPAQCIAPLCNPYIIEENIAGDLNSAGIPISGASSMDAGDGSYTERSNPDVNSLGADHSNMIKENYDHFASEIDFDDIGKEITVATLTNSNRGAQLSGAVQDPDDGTEVYYRSGPLTIDFSTKYTVNGAKKIIFVKGDLTITTSSANQQLIEALLVSDSYIAFIVSGDINIDPSVGNTLATSTNVNLEGVFVADGSINIQGYSDTSFKDRKFIGEGTFVGWSGIGLGRDYKNDGNVLDAADNNENPIEVFDFRPDFNKNTPNIMKRPSLVWQEVN